MRRAGAEQSVPARSPYSRDNETKEEGTQRKWPGPAAAHLRQPKVTGGSCRRAPDFSLHFG